jgi:hypothetical protein
MFYIYKKQEKKVIQFIFLAFLFAYFMLNQIPSSIFFIDKKKKFSIENNF